jgi:hypothetical protein
VSVLSVSPLFASQKSTLGDWEERFILTNNIVVIHTPQYVQFDEERATEQVCIPKGSEYNDFIYPASLNILRDVSREEFIKNLIDSELYNYSLLNKKALTQPSPVEAGRLLSRREVVVTLKRYSKYYQIYGRLKSYRYSY